VPYGCANAQSGITPVRLCGLGAIEPLYVQYNVNHVSIVYPGEGHVPWQNNQNEFNQIDSVSTQFFYTLMCGTTAVNDLKFEADVTMYPNPTSSVVNLRTSVKTSAVSVLDNMGRTVLTQADVNGYNTTFNTQSLPKGIYFVRLQFGDSNYATAVRKLVIE
jgi:hypothetical protein